MFVCMYRVKNRGKQLNFVAMENCGKLQKLQTRKRRRRKKSPQSNKKKQIWLLHKPTHLANKQTTTKQRWAKHARDFEATTRCMECGMWQHDVAH